MRSATCIADLKLTLLGNTASVAISQGWQGDLDQILGVQEIPATTDAEGKQTAPARSVAMTIADALGHHLTPENFEIATPAGRAPKVKASPAAAPQSQE